MRRKKACCLWNIEKRRDRLRCRFERIFNWSLTPIHTIHNSLTVMHAVVEPSLATTKADDKFQFERHGYFAADRVDHAAGKLVFNLAVGLKDGWGK